MFSFISAWTDNWANNRDADDLRRHHAHYDITVMYLDLKSKYLIWCMSWGHTTWLATWCHEHGQARLTTLYLFLRDHLPCSHVHLAPWSPTRYVIALHKKNKAPKINLRWHVLLPLACISLFCHLSTIQPFHQTCLDVIDWNEVYTLPEDNYFGSSCPVFPEHHISAYDNKELNLDFHL